MKKLFTLIAAALMAVGASAATITTIWEGSETFDESWSGSFKVESSKFSDIKVGDKIIVTAKPEAAVSWQWGAQVFIKTNRGGWAQIASTIAVSAAGEFSIEVSDAEITIEEKKEDESTVSVQTSILKELQEYGMIVQGIDATVTKIEKSVYPKYEETGTTIEFNEWGQIMKDQLAAFSGDDKVVFNYKVEGDATGVVGWGIGNLKSLGGNVTLKEISVEGIGNYSIAFTMDELKDALDDTNTQYNTNGVALSLWAQKGATPSRINVVVYKAIADEPAAGGDTWNFETAVSAADKASLEAEGSTWKAPAITYVKDADGNPTTEISYVRYELNAEISAKVKDALGEFVALKGNNGTELEWTKGLTFTRYSNALKAGNIRLDAYSRLGLNGSGIAMKISGLKKDDIIKIKFASTNEEDRGFELTNAATNDADAKTKILSGTDKAAVEFELKVAADGDVILQTTNGVYIYAIAVNGELPTGIQNIKAATKVVENNVIYNLAGQRVNESYKGIVIKNGKKYIQK